MLRDQSGDYSGENIAGSTRRHSWVAVGIHPDIAAGGRDQCAVSLQDNNQLMLTSESLRNIHSIGLNSRNAPPH